MTIPSLSIELNSEKSKPTFLESRKTKKDNEALVSWILSSYKKAKENRVTTERQWYLNLAFFFGRQNVVVASVSNSGTTTYRLTVPKAPPWRVRAIHNKIRPLIRKELAKWTSQKPTVYVMPASTDDDEISAALAAEHIWESVYRRKNVQAILKRAAFWAAVCGTGFVKDYWNPNVTDNDSQQRGDFCIEAVTPFHIFVPDLKEEDIENQPWVIHASTKSLEWVQRAYGDAVKDINPNVTQARDVLEPGFLNLIGAQDISPDAVLCLEIWIKPGMHKAFPQGGMVTVIGDTLVQRIDSWPYQHAEYPFSKIEAMESAKFYGDSVIVDLIPLQKEYNRTHSQIIEAKNRTAKPQFLAQEGSVDPRRITTEPGQYILYKPGYQPPTPVTLTSLPSYVLQELDRLQADMDDISGQHEISKGGTPSGVTAATAISYLQEQDDTMRSHAIGSVEDAVQKVGRHTLSHANQFWTTERTVKMVGPDGAFDAQMFSQQNLRGNLDLYVEAGSAMPQSKAAKQAFITDLMKMQFVDPQEGLKVLGMAGIDKLYENIQVDIRQAQRENLRMAQYQPPAPTLPEGTLPPGAPPEMAAALLAQLTQQQPQELSLPEEFKPNDFDNHAVHIQTHNKFRKSQQFERLSPQAKVFFAEHVRLHQEWLQMELMQQQGQPGTENGGPAPVEDATLNAGG